MSRFEEALEKVELDESAKVSDELGVPHEGGLDPLGEDPHALDIMPRPERGQYGNQSTLSTIARKAGHAAITGIDRLLSLKGRGYDQ
ncbi:MAG: hypothetical protein U5L95_01315 [Candidatus Saccharibacteria bacterium]|nr:hypothetical protein [Candidatus Saccharibacteria bacterium]